MATRKSNSIFRIDPEYYTFVSGALISIPITMLFEIKDNYTKCAFWLGLVLSILTSFFCFKLSINLKDVHEAYNTNKKAVGDTADAWSAAIKEARVRCIILLFLTLITLALSVTCVWKMQFTDTVSVTHYYASPQVTSSATQY